MRGRTLVAVSTAFTLAALTAVVLVDGGQNVSAPTTTRVGTPPSAKPAPSRRPGPAILPQDCPRGYIVGLHLGDPVMCTPPPDPPPPGVDVHAYVPTDVLVTRRGASVATNTAANYGGSVAAITATNYNGMQSGAALAAASNVPCDGDGVSGYRVQAMYVVEAGKSNRFANLNASLKQWAAGVDYVVNRSAAKTGGLRRVRFVTAGSGTSCTAAVTSVTVPAGSLASFSKQVAAMRNLGYNRADRKYLMWTDSNVLCGIGSIFYDTRPTQDNYNNGYAAMYGRVDPGCWGFADSVEAHELGHNLGAVQPSAPHGTDYSHCTDDADRMCYADGTSKAMVSTCTGENEALLDCRNDDYFSTKPAAGSWLATHWNAASSRWLIGGGDGVNSSGQNQVAVTLTADPSLVQSGGTVVLAGLLTYLSGASTGTGVSGKTITLTYSPKGLAQVKLSAVTSTAGTYKASLRATATGTVVALAASTPATTAAQSAAVTVTVLAPPVPSSLVGFTGMAPYRVLDTRIGTGAPKAKLGAGGTLTLTVPGLPAGATAVALNVTVTDPTAGSYLTVYPGGVSRPTASNLNFVTGQTIPNMALVPLGAGGSVTFYNNSGTVNVIADLQGYFKVGSGAGFTGKTPTRVLDTRIGTGTAGVTAKLGAGGTLTLTVPGLPAGATAVSLNVTVTNPTAGSYLSVYPGGGSRPTASSLNFGTGQTIANRVLVGLGAGGTVTFYNNSGTVNVIADLQGYFKVGSGAGFTGKTPTRVLDTRIGTGTAGVTAKLGAGGTLTLTVPGLPAGATAVALNVTVTNPTAGSYLTVYPGGVPRPIASNINFVAGQTIANLVLDPLGSGAQVSFYNNSGTVHLVADLVGYYG